MDTARAAEMSWPDRNYQFRRWWGPPQKRNPVLAATSTRADYSNSSSAQILSAIDGPAQRAIAFALRRAAQIDRQADLLLALGKHLQAHRLSHRARQIREVAA
jgi:hypothetical protein